jgi:hypothetical protein
LANARNQWIFSVTAIFLTNFLINMPKIQKIHFFLLLIYIIIKEAVRGPGAFARGNSARNVPGNSQQPAFGNEMVPGNGPTAPGKPEKTDKTAQEGQITDKRGMDTWSTKYG